jgi:hypothetical protein
MNDNLHRDLVTERQLLALVLTGDRRIAAEFLRLPTEVFSSERHKVVALVLRAQIAANVGPVDVFMAAAAAAERAGTDGQAEEERRFVHNLALTAPPTSSWHLYADAALDAMHIRDMLVAGHRITQLAENAAAGADLDEVIARAGEALASASERRVSTSTAPPISLQELLDQQDEPHDWLVPGLLERMDRLMLTGFEGTGKSYLLAQMALCVAAGLHPFTGRVVKPAGYRVLVLDCENSKPQIRRRYRQTAAIVNRLREENGLGPIDWSQHMRLNIRPDGIDLGDKREIARVESAIAATQPDLVVGGPLYKMHRANLNDETAARDLVGVLDDLRGRYRFTLILEAHVGHVGETQGGRKLRPTGSSLFLRWPEFGYGVRAFDPDAGEEHPKTVQMVAWRGSRDERDWPGLLSHSATELPWTPSDNDYRRRHYMGPYVSSAKDFPRAV